MRDRQTLSLRYGRGFQEFVIPASADIFDIREPQRSVSQESFRQGLAGVFPEIISEGQIAIVVADKTRLCGYPTVLPWLLEMLYARGCSPRTDHHLSPLFRDGGMGGGF